MVDNTERDFKCRWCSKFWRRPIVVYRVGKVRFDFNLLIILMFTYDWKRVMVAKAQRKIAFKIVQIKKRI